MAVHGYDILVKNPLKTFLKACISSGVVLKLWLYFVNIIPMGHQPSEL